jgi:hypothetical protein
MKIAVSGTHGTGKSFSAYEIANVLKKEYRDKSIVVLNEVVREAPFPINSGTTGDSFLWSFSAQIEKELFLLSKHEMLVCDRTVLDCFAYAKYFNVSTYLESLLPFAFNYLNTYDIIYYKKLESNEYNYSDGVRDNSDVYREAVEKILLELYKDSGVPITFL